MLIVFVALTAISLFISLLPKVLPLLNRILPVIEHNTKPKAKDPSQKTAPDKAVIAAIAYAMHHRKGDKK